MRQSDAAKLIKELIISESANVSTIVKRDSAGDISARLIRQTYQDQNTISGGIVYRVNNSSDNYLRVCNSPSAIKTWLSAADSTHNHDSTYLKMVGGTLSGTLMISDPNAEKLILRRDSDTNVVLKFDSPNYSRFLGIASGVLKFGNSADVSGTGYAIYHEGNKPTATDIGAAPTAHGHSNLVISDARNTDPTPDAIEDRSLTTFFNNQYGDTWRSGITIAGWSNGYTVWQLSNPASTTVSEALAFRSGVNATWNPWRKIYHEGFKPTAADIGAAASSHTHSYLQLTGGTVNGKITDTVEAGTTLDASLYAKLSFEARSTDGGPSGIGFHRTGKSGVALYSIGNEAKNMLRVRNSSNLDYDVYHSGNKPTPDEIGAAKVKSVTLESRTTDPTSPEVGYMWLRTDL